MKTVLVVPAYNEAGRLDPEPFESFLESEPEVGLVLVDDGSSDRTADVLEDLARGWGRRVDVLRLPENRGKAEAVRAGVSRALEDEPDAFGYWDADLATPFDELPRLRRVLERHPGVDVVMGARVKLLGREIRRRRIRHYPGRVFATAVSVALRLPVYDTQCGAKLFRNVPGTRRAFADPFLSGWIFDVEVLARFVREVRKQGREPEEAIHEVPLRTWTDVRGSKTRPADFLRAAVDLVRIWFRYRRSEPDSSSEAEIRANAGDS